ncbi:MAG: hypothetical protein WA021_05305 [Minisyncoccia bacterium]
MATLPHAIARLEKGLFPAIAKARRYAGHSGRIATLPELVTARVNEVPGSFTTWFSTSTALYFGLSKYQKPIFIVAHGIGPLADLTTCMAAYTQRAEERNHDWFGRIPEPRFSDLELGVYGAVEIVDAAPYMSTHEELKGCLASHATVLAGSANDPLIRAIFGRDAGAYLEMHAKPLREEHDPDIAKKRLGEVKFEHQMHPSLYWANFLTLEVVGVGASLCDREASTRFVAVCNDQPIKKITEAPRLSDLAKHAKTLESESDKMRSDISVLIAMEAADVL